MIGQDYDKLKSRWLEFWNRENHDRPILNVTAWKKTPCASPPPAPKTVEEMWQNTEYTVKAARAAMENTLYFAEAFPVYNPNLGPDVLGAMSGLCDIDFSETTSWAVHKPFEWADLPPIKLDETSKWWQKIKEMTEYAAKDSKGDYLIGLTDLHAGTDGLVSLRGPQELCIDLLDCPDEVQKRINQLNAMHFEVFSRLCDILAPVQEGTTNWMGIWHPEKRWYVTCSDFSCLISKEDYHEAVMPGLNNELDFLEASMYHLDGPDALRHLPAILSLDKLKGVQWVPGESSLTARHWIDIMKQIQAAGKCLQIYVPPEDIKEVCEALDPEGLNLITYLSDEEDAKALIRQVEDIYRAK